MEVSGLLLFSIFSAAIFIRAAVSSYPYSGAGCPPMFGDYEAQRHWMEITYNLPLSQWYVNSSLNFLEYWGLDYPPLTAYHSWILGSLSVYLNPDWIALTHSQGYESYGHKIFMRSSVLVTDILIFFPAVATYVYCITKHSLKTIDAKYIILIGTILFQPALILIDHGHFQYNSISLGFAVWGITSVIADCDILGSIAFCLALNYKQMELYHALPFFFYLLGKACTYSKVKGELVITIVKLGLSVISIFVICWIPFYVHGGKQGIFFVFVRIFPFYRGIFEDKVASFWCSLSIILKLRNIFSISLLIRITSVTTLLVTLPSLWNLLRNPTPYRFLLSLVTSSLSFFLFSFHVHEKSILLVTLPVSLLIPYHPFLATWFNIVAAFSMYPLLIKDGISFPTWIVNWFFGVSSFSSVILCTSKRLSCIQSIMMMLSLTIMMALCLLYHALPTLPSLPDLFPVLISCYSCLLFMLTLIYFIHIQMCLPRDDGKQWNFLWHAQQYMYEKVGRFHIKLNLDHKDL